MESPSQLTMVYSTVYTYGPTQTYSHSDDMIDEYGMSHWQHHLTAPQPQFEGYYNPSEPQLANHRNHFQELGDPPFAYTISEETTHTSYNSPHPDLHHPYYSSPSTLCDSSSVSSGTLSPSIGSRATSLLPSPEICYNELHVAMPGYDTHDYDNAPEAYASASCVTMQSVQREADTFHEDPAEDLDVYTVQEPQELVFAAPTNDEETPSEYDQDSITVARPRVREESSSEPERDPASGTDNESEYEPQPAAALRRRRGPNQRSNTTIRSRNRVTKHISPRRPRSAPAGPPSSTNDPSRAFLCPLAPYGCTAVFSAKNEWKRHAATQHLQLGFWRCDQCTYPPSRPNDFNRKDLYVQHVRRMHPPTSAVMPTNIKDNSSSKKGRAQSKVAWIEVTLNNAAERCYQRMREAPETCCCVFCDERFEGATSLESRLEHMGKHMERQKKAGLSPVAVQDWREDKGLEAWLVSHGMLVRRRGRLEVPK